MRTGILLLLLVGLAACSSSSDQRYLDSRVLPSLEVPPDLISDSEDGNAGIASLAGLTNSTTKIDKRPVLARVDSIQLEGQGDFYWLTLDEPAESLYSAVKNFWVSEGFQLKVDEPAIGVMQTDWVHHKVGAEDKDQSFLARLFSKKDLSATQDQYRTRIARDPDSQLSRVYITHRGTEYRHKEVSAKNNAEPANEWAFRPYTNELEVEMLSRLMLYLGLEPSETEQRLQQATLFAPRARLVTNFEKDETYMLISDGYSRSWYRTLHQLDRMDLEVISANYKTAFSSEGAILVNTGINIEVKKPGFFSAFSSAKTTQQKQVSLVFSVLDDDTTQVVLETEKGEVDKSPEALKFLSQLFQALK